MAELFARDHNRVPTKSEKRRLVIGAFIATTAIGFLIAGMMFAFDAEFRQVITELSGHWQITFLIAAFVFLFEFAMIRFSFGLFASMFEKHL